MSKLFAPPEKSGVKLHPLLRLVIEFGPLGAFFGGYFVWDLMVATAIFMVAIVISLGLSVSLERRVPLMPLVTCVVVLVFGGLTLLLDSELFIKMKPTIVNSLFAFVLFTGLAFGRPFLKYLFGPVFRLDDAGWKKLSFRWACFFVFMALLNEAVWRLMSTDFWVSFKVFGNMPITLVFALAQIPLLNRHAIEDGEGATPADGGEDGHEEREADRTGS